MWVRPGFGTCGRPWAALAVAALTLAGCGRAGPTPAEFAGLDHEYVSVASDQTCMVLLLENDGGFLVLERARDPERYASREMPMRPEPEPVATGRWVFSDGLLDLEGDGW